MRDEILTIEEVCQWQKISRRTLERWREKGLPFEKVGAVIRFNKQEVLKWIELQSNLKEYLIDKSLIVFGSSGSGKTTDVVIPVIRQWKGAILAYDLNGELLHSKKVENELGISDANNDINKAIDSLKQGTSVYLLATFKNKMKSQLEGILSYLAVNKINYPLLIVIEEYLSLGDLNDMLSLISISGSQNIKFLISIMAESKEHVINILGDQYGETGLKHIIENFDFIDMDLYSKRENIKKLSIIKSTYGAMGRPVITLKYHDGQENLNFHPKNDMIDIKLVGKICEAIKSGYEIEYNDNPVVGDLK